MGILICFNTDFQFTANFNYLTSKFKTLYWENPVAAIMLAWWFLRTCYILWVSWDILAGLHAIMILQFVCCINQLVMLALNMILIHLQARQHLAMSGMQMYWIFQYTTSSIVNFKL